VGGVFTTSECFIVLDLYVSSAVMPVSPSPYLEKVRENIKLNKSETNNFNSMIMGKAENLYFQHIKIP
jgi:hypothetical protein